MQRHDVASTLGRRYIYVMCPLGSIYYKYSDTIITPHNTCSEDECHFHYLLMCRNIGEQYRSWSDTAYWTLFQRKGEYTDKTARMRRLTWGLAVYIWAQSETVPPDTCAQRTFRSTDAFAQSDHILYWVYFGLQRIQCFLMRYQKVWSDYVDAQADLSLRLPYMSEGTFSYIPTHLIWGPFSYAVQTSSQHMTKEHLSHTRPVKVKANMCISAVSPETVLYVDI